MSDIWCAPYFAVRNFSLSFSQTGLILKLTLLFGVPGVVLFFRLLPWCTDWVFSGSSILIWNSKLQSKLFFCKIAVWIKETLDHCIWGCALQDCADLIKISSYIHKTQDSKARREVTSHDSRVLTGSCILSKNIIIRYYPVNCSLTKCPPSLL